MELTEVSKQFNFMDAVDECDTEEVEVPLGHGNIYPVRMLVHTP